MTDTIFKRKSKVHKKGEYYFLLKRCMDISAALFGGLFMIFPMILIALLIRMDSEGPVIYQQERLGKNGIPFTLYKFRTMRVDAEKNGPQLTQENDCRCTAIGYYLRKSHLDELPQLWNILKGDMSLVGPRPEREFFYNQYDSLIPGFRNRLSVKPGLTGLAQVRGGYDLPPKEKLEHDMEYIRTQSIQLDLFCILHTIRLILTGEGAR